MAKSQENIQAPKDPDPLAAVVLHVLVTEGQEGISFEEVSRSCERDLANQAEREEMEVALAILVRDELAVREEESGADSNGSEGAIFRPTRAAVRAAELSF